MTTIEVFATSIAAAFLVGVLATVACYEWQARRLRSSIIRYRIEAHNAKAENDTMRRHLGTPYINTTGPGLRVVGGQTMYSSDWLNDR